MPRTKLPEGSVPVTFRLPQEVRRLLLDKARREKMTLADLIRRALWREIPINAAHLNEASQRNISANRSRTV